jgi:hypothetical protein
MSLVSDIITSARYDINDASSTLFTDAAILSVVKRAVTRANRIVQRNAIQFAKKKATLTTVANQAYVALPTDFDVDIGLWRDADHTKLEKSTEMVWEQIVTADSLENWYLDLENSRILFNGTPTSAETLTFYYYPLIDISAYTTATTMPWSGRLDDIIVEYVSLRLKNTSEMNVDVDLQLLQDFENQITLAYQPTSVLASNGAGWL